MRWAVGVSVLVGVMLAGIAVAEAQYSGAPPAHRPPHWAEAPSSDDVEAVWPKGVTVSGRVVLRCDVSASGHMKRCIVTEESPPGMGFGTAALKLTGLFRVEKGDDQGSLDGAKVNIPIRFQLPH